MAFFVPSCNQASADVKPKGYLWLFDHTDHSPHTLSDHAVGGGRRIFLRGSEIPFIIFHHIIAIVSTTFRFLSQVAIHNHVHHVTWSFNAQFQNNERCTLGLLKPQSAPFRTLSLRRVCQLSTSSSSCLRLRRNAAMQKAVGRRGIKRVGCLKGLSGDFGIGFCENLRQVSRLHFLFSIRPFFSFLLRIQWQVLCYPPSHLVWNPCPFRPSLHLWGWYWKDCRALWIVLCFWKRLSSRAVEIFLVWKRLKAKRWMNA